MFYINTGDPESKFTERFRWHLSASLPQKEGLRLRKDIPLDVFNLTEPPIRADELGQGSSRAKVIENVAKYAFIWAKTIA